MDAVAVYCEQLDRCYLLPAPLFANRRGVYLRIAATRNGQRASLHWARDHELSGAIAQLGERLAGSQKVAGSSPAGSTSLGAEMGTQRVGAHEFRNHFG